jgi:hypothetical protein
VRLMLESAKSPFRTMLGATTQQVLRTLHRGDGLPISTLLGPLRLDVWVVRDFLRFYLGLEHLAATRFHRFVDEATNHRYWDLVFGWFNLYQPEGISDMRTFRPHFAHQVERCIAVWRTVVAGYDSRFPIEVKFAATVSCTATRKRVFARSALGDGGHRLASLMVQGYTVLPHSYYRLTWYRRRQPYDGTWVLTHRRGVPASEYFAFLSYVYGARVPISGSKDFLQYIRAEAPHRLDEVGSVLRADGFSPD